MRYLLECDGHIAPDHSSNIRGSLWTHIRTHNIHLGVLFKCITASRRIAAVQNMEYSVEYCHVMQQPYQCYLWTGWQYLCTGVLISL